jgi:hypothetical protein
MRPNRSFADHLATGQGRRDRPSRTGVWTVQYPPVNRLALQRKRFAPATMEKAEWTFRDLINPYIGNRGNRPIAEIMPLELLKVFRCLEARGKHETAHRTKQRCGQVFRYAVATGRTLRDPTPDLRGALTLCRKRAKPPP